LTETITNHSIFTLYKISSNLYPTQTVIRSCQVKGIHCKNDTLQLRRANITAHRPTF